MVLIPEILQAHAMIPVIRARIMETTEIKNVDLSPVKKKGQILEYDSEIKINQHRAIRSFVVRTPKGKSRVHTGFDFI